eukprot:COSAG01_NODE_49250_length_373_cov_39.974453_1_plen_24_part_01
MGTEPLRCKCMHACVQPAASQPAR